MKLTVILSLALACMLAACSQKEEAKTSPTPPVLTIGAAASNQATSSAPSTSTAQVDDKMTERAFEVRNAGELYLKFPKEWKDAITNVLEMGRRFDSIRFRPTGNNEFELSVNIVNVGETNTANLDPKVVLAKVGQNELSRSVETNLDIQLLTGPQVSGCYFTVTDKDLTIALRPPGEFPYLTQGYAKLGGLVLTFRMVSSHLAADQKAALEMVRTAKLVKKTSP